MMTTNYHWKNIRKLLLLGFSEQNLRQLIQTEFEPLSYEIADSASKAQIVQQLLTYTKELHKIEHLLTLAEEHNPVLYHDCGSYQEAIAPTVSLISDLGQELLRTAFSPPSLRTPEASITTNILDMATIKTCLHAQSEVVASEAIEQANRDQDDHYAGLIPMTVALRWKRGYTTFLRKLLDVAKRKMDDDLTALAQVLFHNHEALIPLLARWKLQGSDWLLPDEEPFPCEIGRSLLDNTVPDYDGRAALAAAQAEHRQQGGVETAYHPNFVERRMNPKADMEQALAELRRRLPQ